MRLLCALGNSTDIATWSNIPYFFLEAGKRNGFLDGGIVLNPSTDRVRDYGWRLARYAASGKFGGRQYSRSFLQELFARGEPIAADTEIISHFPLLPETESFDGDVSFYIDATLTQNFNNYGIGKHLSDRYKEEILGRELRQYSRANHVVAMSNWAARSLIEDYGLSSRKVHVIRPGANLIFRKLTTNEGLSRTCLHFDPLRLGFVGKDWRRKNLAFVLEVADRLIARGCATEVVAIGSDVKTLPRHSALRPIGFIDKRIDHSRFTSLMRSVHFGCLFSYAEAFGISNLEFAALGVPLLTWDVGGLADSVLDGSGHLFTKGAKPEEVAECIQSYVHDPERYQTLRRTVFGRRGEFTWDATAARFQELFGGS